MGQKKTTPLTKFKGGAQRKLVQEAFELICPTGELRLAEVYAEGAANYGEHNWTKDMPQGVIIRHMRRHLNLYRRGDRSEPHAAKIAWAAFALIHYDEKCRCHEHGRTQD